MADNTVLKGNTIDNFGRHMPCPHIDKIELWDVLEGDRTDASEQLGFEVTPEDSLSKVRVHFSFLIHKYDDFDEEK